LKSVFPKARLLLYCEFFYGGDGRDVGFDPEFPATGLDGDVGLRLKNATTLLGLSDCDRALSPTEWQRATFPIHFQSKIDVIHEGVDTDLAKPDPDAVFDLGSGRRLTRVDQVITFVARNLEPMRGYHVFMRALPRILAKLPAAHILIVGATTPPTAHARRGERPGSPSSWPRSPIASIRPGSISPDGCRISDSSARCRFHPLTST
jgi:glycosyltransferase involved in cell wall biosynthesis